MTLLVMTAQIRYAFAKLPDALDVTRKGAWIAHKAGGEAPGEPWAPSWPLLKAAKAGELSFKAYDERYMLEMRTSYKTNRRAWDALLSCSRVVLCCYCTDSEMCHRFLLRTRILPKLGAIDGGEV